MYKVLPKVAADNANTNFPCKNNLEEEEENPAVTNSQAYSESDDLDTHDLDLDDKLTPSISSTIL